MAGLYIMVCVVCLMSAGMAGWDLKPPGHNNAWGIFWLLMAIVCMVLIVTTRNTFVA